MPNVRATVNQVVQIGAETTPGTAVPAGKLLSAFLWTFGEKAATKQFIATGRKNPSASELLTEFSMGKISGNGDFGALIYPIASTFGKGPQCPPPAVPALATATTGGTVLAGTYQVIITYVNANGESIGSSSASITTTGSASTITVTSPAAFSNATQYNVYMTAANGTTFTKQGSGTNIGTNFVLSAPPGAGAAPPTSNTTGTGPALHSPSTTANDWTFLGPVAGVASPITYTLQQGDVVDAEQYAYLIFSGWGYTFTRKQEVQISGDWFSQTFTDGISLTASPTNVALLPMTGAQFNVYLDTTSAGIGVTQLTDPLKVDFKPSNYFGQYFPINRANASYTSHLDTLPKNELKLTLQANSTGIAVRGNYLQTGTRAYVRVSGVGATIDTPNSIKAAMTHDMAVFVSDMAEFSDVDGVYAVEYTLQVAEDMAWTQAGMSQKLLLTNLLAGL